MQHFYDKIEGWFTFARLYEEVVKNAQDNSHFIEVGTWKGRSSAFMAVEIINSGKKIKFDCIDPFIEVDGIPGYNIKHDDLKKSFIDNMKPVEDYFENNQFTLYAESSPAVTSYYEDNSIDFIFIDGSHEYLDVVADIMGWLPKMKIGGIISGHDYLESTCGVRKAVDQIFGPRNWSDNFGSGCWMITVTQELYDNILKGSYTI